VKCPNPRKVARGLVPCGGCIICRKHKARLWEARILLEQRSTDQQCWFVTLTYADDQIPLTPEHDQTLRKAQLQAFVHNYRTRVSDFRYLAVGEYGDESLRPHYHLAIFPTEPFDIQGFLHKWERRGFASASPLQGRRAAYMCKYALKRLTKQEDPRLLPGQEPEFRSSSRDPALGLVAAGEIAAMYYTREGAKILAERGDIERTIRINGKIYPLDDYMKRKIREELGIPVRHIDRLTHEGYYRWHQNSEHEADIPLLELEEHRHREKETRRKAKRKNA
jgi:hypothetical protein